MREVDAGRREERGRRPALLSRETWRSRQATSFAAVTFTNKAAREMKERVGQTLGRKEARGLMISTFHTLGLDIIRLALNPQL